MANFELWVKACEEFNTGIYKLTKNPEDGHGVYETIKVYYPPGSYNTMRDVCYHLWWHDKHQVVTSQSPVDLYQIFDRLSNEHSKGENNVW